MREKLVKLQFSVPFEKFHREDLDLKDKGGHWRPSTVDDDQLKTIVEVQPTTQLEKLRMNSALIIRESFTLHSKSER